MVKTKLNDFVEINYTGYSNGQIFDSNIEEDIKKINKEAKAKKTIVAIGHGMVVKGFDRALEGKELNKEYEVDVPCKEGFGERKRELIRTIPMKSFIEQKVNPQSGMVLALDNQVVKILSVSGARVTADFNNLLAGKDLKYKFKILRITTDVKEKSETLFETFINFVPELEIKEKEIVAKGPKILESVIKHYKEKFKELIGRELAFEEKDLEKPQEANKEKVSSNKTDLEIGWENEKVSESKTEGKKNV
jgi:FKBP-type peptidyl-prolyl cis-trans isomerase SlyD